VKAAETLEQFREHTLRAMLFVHNGLTTAMRNSGGNGWLLARKVCSARATLGLF